MRRAAALLVAVAACHGDDSTPSGDPTGASGGWSTTTEPDDEPVGADSTGGELGCVDDYHGNQDPGAAHEVTLDPAGTATPVVVALGNGVAVGPAELGGDELFVCHAAPSDFFALQTTCAGYLAIEVRQLEGEVPDLVLHDGAGPPLEELVGAWPRFFLKPLQRHVGAGTHLLEVRHAGGEAGRYGLTVLTLPDSTCR